jgi:alpha-tubulin suppressor-like RCC1 family protein
LSGPRDARKWRVLLWAALAAGCADAFETSEPKFDVVPAAEYPVPDTMTRTQVDTVALAVTLDEVAVTSASVTWQSSDNSVLRVSSILDSLHAEVIAQGVGNAEITATVTPGRGIPDTVLQDTVRVLERWIAVSVGRDLACGLNVDSMAYCWDADLQPSLVPGLAGVAATDIQVGHSTACVMVHHTPLCWGQNGLGEIGNGDELRHTIPVEGAINPTPPDALVGLSAGGTSFCGNFHNPGRVDSFFVQCWGNSAFHQLGVPRPHTTCRFSFKDYPCRRDLIGGDDTLRILIHADSVDAGESHACAIEEAPTPGLLHCWGAGATGQLGSPRDTLPCPSDSTLPCGGPEVVDSSLHFISVSAGWDRFVPNPSAQSTSWFGEGHTCALAEDLTVYCWGKNDYDQLGAASDATCNRLPTATPAAVPCRSAPLAVQAPAPGTFKAVSAGSEHTCGIMANDSIYCWGSDSLGQLGDSSTQSRGTPAPIRGDRLFRAVSAGPYRTCGLTLDEGRIFCWGSDISSKPIPILEPQ